MENCLLECWYFNPVHNIWIKDKKNTVRYNSKAETEKGIKNRIKRETALWMPTDTILGIGCTKNITWIYLYFSPYDTEKFWLTKGMSEEHLQALRESGLLFSKWKQEYIEEQELLLDNGIKIL